VAVLAVAILALVPVLPMPKPAKRAGYGIGILTLLIAAVMFFWPEINPAPSEATITAFGNGNCNVTGSGNHVNCAVPISPEVASQGTGAMIRIDPDDAEHLKNGSYYLPVEIGNIGALSVSGYVTVFGQNVTKSPASAQEEDAFMKSVTGDLRKASAISPEAIQDTGSDLTPGYAVKLRETKRQFSPAEYKQIQEGTLFVTYGVAVVYSDEYAKQKHTLYYAERCFHWDANLGDYVNCAGHNFSKNIWSTN
jgi:hypothetical protein